MSPIRISLLASAFFGCLLVVPTVHAADGQAVIVPKHKNMGAYIQQTGPKDRNLAMERLQDTVRQREKVIGQTRNIQKRLDEAGRQMLNKCRDCFR